LHEQRRFFLVGCFYFDDSRFDRLDDVGGTHKMNEEEKNKLIEEKLKKYNEGFKDGYEQGFKDGEFHGVEQAQENYLK
tara:strand:- start:121 stop:354 length:234 start_codon:yes stop_codon:yes gene_type:complete